MERLVPIERKISQIAEIIRRNVMGDRPLLWKVLPDSIKESLYHRVLYPPSRKWHSLYESSSLRFAPSVEVRLEPNDRMHGQIAFLGYYDKELSKIIARMGREKRGKFVDVGANIGYYSLLWVAQSPENEAVAVEPSPRVQSLLQENIERNGFGDRITIAEVAAGQEKGEVKFDVGPEDEVGWGGVTEKEEETVTEGSKEVIEVPQRRLDEIVDGPVTLMKVDVEGAEAWVFQGAEGILESQKVEMICFENNRVRTRRLEIEEDAPFNVLKQYGYDIVERNNTFWAEPRG